VKKAAVITPALACVAGIAKSLEAVWEVVLDQPCVEDMTPVTDLLAVSPSLPVDVVNRQVLSGATAGAGRAVVIKDLPSTGTPCDRLVFALP
jgi:hypothetical protein